MDHLRFRLSERFNLRANWRLNLDGGGGADPESAHVYPAPHVQTLLSHQQDQINLQDSSF